MIKLAAVALSAAFAASPLYAQTDHSHDHGGVASATQASQMSEGEVRRIDKAARKITLRHGPLKNLDMPAMTMVFQVQNAALLDKVKAGDKVRFTAEKLEGGFTITALEPGN